MSDAISNPLLTSKPEQKSQLLDIKNKIDKVVQEYNQTGIPEIPKKSRKDLQDRLILTIGSNTKTVSSTHWRNQRAQDIYLQVLNASSHLYVAFISVVSPTACIQSSLRRTVVELLQLNKETPVRLNLDVGVEEFFKSVAVAGAFTEDPRFLEFMRSLFPDDHSHSSALPEIVEPSPKTKHHSIARYTSSFGPEQPVAVQSPALWVDQDSTISIAQLDKLRHNPEPGSQHGPVMIHDIRNSTPQNQSSTVAHDQATEERSSKRLRLGSEHIPGNLELPGHGQYYSFSCMRRHMVENLPEPFRTGMKTNNLWCNEKESGGLAITNSLKMYVPERINDDFLLVLRLGYFEGFNIFNMFGLGDVDSPESEEAAAREARD